MHVVVSRVIVRPCSITMLDESLISPSRHHHHAITAPSPYHYPLCEVSYVLTISDEELAGVEGANLTYLTANDTYLTTNDTNLTTNVRCLTANGTHLTTNATYSTTDATYLT